MAFDVESPFAWFTESSRSVIRHSKEYAVERRSQSIDYVDLIVACLKVQSMALWLLQANGMDVDFVVHDIKRIVGVGTGPAFHGDMPFTTTAKEGLEAAVRYARMSGRNYIDPLDLLCGCLSTGDHGGVNSLLAQHGIDVDVLRQRMGVAEDFLVADSMDEESISKLEHIGELYAFVRDELLYVSNQRQPVEGTTEAAVADRDEEVMNMGLLIDLTSECLRLGGKSINGVSREMETVLRSACLHALEVVRKSAASTCSETASDAERARFAKTARMTVVDEMTATWVGDIESEFRALLNK